MSLEAKLKQQATFKFIKEAFFFTYCKQKLSKPVSNGTENLLIINKEVIIHLAINT